MANLPAQQEISFATNGIIHQYFGEAEGRIAFSSNGEDLAMSWNKQIEIVKMSNHKIDKTIPMEEEIRSISYSPDGEFFVAGSVDKKLYFYNATTYDNRIEIEVTNEIRIISFSRDAKWFFVGGKNFFTILRKGRNTRTYEAFHTETENYGINEDNSFVYRSSFASSNDDIVAFSVGKVAFRYDINKKTVLDKYEQNGRVNAIQFSPFDQFLAIGGQTGEHSGYFRVYNVLTSSMVYKHELDTEVKSICYSQASKIIIVGTRYGGRNENLHFHDINVATKQILYKIRMPAAYSIIKQSTNSSKIAIVCGDRTIIYDTNLFSRTIVNEFSEENNISTMAYSPNGDELAYGTSDKLMVLNNGISKIEMNLEEVITAMAYSINGEMLACGTNQGHVYIFKKDTQNPIQPYDKNKLVVNRELLDREREIVAIKFSSDGKFLAISAGDEKVILYRLPDYESIKVFEFDFELRKRVMRSIDFCIKENQIAMSGQDGAIVFIHSLIYHDEEQIKKDINSEEKKDFALIYRHQQMEMGSLYALEYSQDEKLIAYGGRKSNMVYVRRADTQKLVGRVEVLGGIVSLSFSPDSKVLAIGSSINTVILFHVEEMDLQNPGNGSDDQANLPTWQRRFCMPIYLPSKARTIMFSPNIQQQQNNTDEHFYYLSLILKKTIRTIRVHKYTAAQPHELIKSCTNQEIITFNKDKKISLYTRDEDENGTMLLEHAGIQEQYGLIAEMMKCDDFIASSARTAIPGYEGSVLTKMADKYMLDDLSKIISISVISSTDVLQDFYSLLLNMAKKELISVVVKLLNAKFAVFEEYKGIDCPEGFFIAETLYARTADNTHRTVTKKREPQLSSTLFDVRKNRWKDLEDDPGKAVKLYLLVVYLPDLGSFKSLKTLTNMQSSKVFNSIALQSVLDALWNDFFRFRFYLQFGFYLILLLSFTAFCEITKYRKQALVNTEDPWWILRLLSVLVFLGLAFFVYVEVRQMQKLKYDYLKKSWNYVQCISMVLVATTMILRLKNLLTPTDYMSESKSERSIAFVSAFALLSVWFGLLSYLRGIKNFAWIITALLYIIRSLTNFIVVVVLVIFSFAVVLRALHDGDPTDLRIDGNFTSEDNQYHDINAPYGNLIMSFHTTIMAGMFATFDLEDLRDSYSYILSLILMLMMLLLVLIIALNAFIAFISEKFEEILIERNAAFYLERAEIIVEIYCLLSDKYRVEIEGKNRWISVVVPASSFSADNNELNPLEIF